MAQSTSETTQDQVDVIRDRLNAQEGLPFLELLSANLVNAASRLCNHVWRNRIYTPSITLAVFLSQVLSDDQSCDDAVDRFQKFRFDGGLPSVGTSTASYCEARNRLPEALIWDLVRRCGRTIHHEAKRRWLFFGRAVKIADGSTLAMPDTPANQAAYPQAKTQAPGVGFPIARILVVFSLAVGTVLEAALGPYQGKQTSELALLRQIIGAFHPGDIFLADRFFCTYWVIATLQSRGVDVVVRLHQRRRADFRQGRRLGVEDRLVTWKKPEQKPDWMSPVEYQAMPTELTVRLLRVRVQDKTKRVRKLEVATTLRDAAKYRKKAIGMLFQQRWHAELDLRTLKSQMKMETLRTKTPEMVGKEVAMHLLAYNLIRGLMAKAARAVAVRPRQLSFTGAQHTIRAFEEVRLYNPSQIAADLPRLVELIGAKRVGDRPGRYEPRAVKRRPKPHPLLTMPRRAAKRLIELGRIPYDKSKYKS